MNANYQVVETVRATLREFWPEIKREQNYFGSHEFNLKVNPWNRQGEQRLPSINLLCQLLSALRSIGWKLIMHSGELIHFGSQTC